jgi:hypothetical protein
MDERLRGSRELRGPMLGISFEDLLRSHHGLTLQFPLLGGGGLDRLDQVRDAGQVELR